MTRWRPLSSATRSSVVIYVLAAVGLWWCYPYSHLVIKAGPLDFFRGFSADSKRLFIGSRCYRTDTGKEIANERFSGSPGQDDATWVRKTSPDGRTIANVFEGTVTDSSTGEIRVKLSDATGTAAAFSADGGTVAIAMDHFRRPDFAKIGPVGWSVKFYDPTTGKERQTLPHDDGWVRGLAFSPDGSKLAMAVSPDDGGSSAVRKIEIWDLASSKLERSCTIEDIGGVENLNFVGDGPVITIQRSRLGTHDIFDFTVPPPHRLVGSRRSMILSANGRLAAASDDQGTELLVWRLGNGSPEPVSRRAYPVDVNATVYPIFISEERVIVNVLSSPGWPRPIEGVRKFIVDRFNGLPPRYFNGQQNWYDIIEPVSGRRLGQLPDSTDTYCVGVSPDGRTLVTVYRPGLGDDLTLWNVPPKTQWFTILGWALLPAGITRLLLGLRVRSRQQKDIV